MLQIGAYELWLAGRRVRLHGNAVPVTARAFDVLAELARHYPAMVSKNALLAAVWPGLVVEENNLQVQISLLRKLLGRDAIATVPGHGYRLTLPVGACETGAEAPAPACAEMLGRTDDIAELTALLRDHRLTCLLGAAGVGKSTLARHVATAVASVAGLPVAWVELADCVSECGVLDAVARATGCDAVGSVTPAALARHLNARRCLLVLDNADRAARGVAALASELMKRGSAPPLLVTTQVRLHLPEEQVYRLTPLAIPPEGCALDDARHYGALALLEARAHGHDHRFALCEAVLPDAIELCHRLDGLPLALELAAARIPALGVAGVLRRLHDPLPLLAKAIGTGPLRQRSLQDALEWSFQLLDPAAQALWCETAVLAPSFSLDELMLRDEGRDLGATLDLLGTLVARALLIFEPIPTPAYRLGEMQRAFALRKRAAAKGGCTGL